MRASPVFAWIGLFLLGSLVGRAHAQGGGPRPGGEEEARRKLLEQMGLRKKDRLPAADVVPPADPPPPGAPPAQPQPSSPAAGPADAGPAPASAARAAVVPFRGRVHEELLRLCRPCHAAGAVAAATRLRLAGPAAADHAAARALVDLAAPRRSLLLTKAAGTQHGGGALMSADGDGYRRVLEWIRTGALLDAPFDSAVATAAAAPERTPSAQPRSTPTTPVDPRPAPSEPPPAPAVSSRLAEGALAAGASAEIVAFHNQLLAACQPCHSVGGPAGTTRFKLAGDSMADLGVARAFVDEARSPQSPLASKAAGVQHGGGSVWPEASAGAQALRAWLAAGAPATSPPPAPPSAAPVPPVAPAHPPSSPPAVAAPPPASHAAHGGLRATIFGQELALNGRFDLALERRGFATNPFASQAQTAVESYHHFLFLGRQSVEDPFVLTAEITSLLFYEAGLRLRLGKAVAHPAGLHLRAGKLLVPFGNEPLFHQSYGGLIGFDQRVLPPVWTALGAAASGYFQQRAVTFSADVYGVQGYALRRPDAVLNLQGDFSPNDDARLALGLRLGLAFAALSGYYSAYFNPLGFDRRLFLQALDVSLWRWRGLPVLDRLVLGAGLLRADVSGKGAGHDYYHFASYWLARLYATDWLYLQYRQGLRTFDNRRNLTYDPRHAGPEDGSAHNLSLTARHHGLSVTLGYFINLEKTAEVDDDLLRLAVAFEF